MDMYYLLLSFVRRMPQDVTSSPYVLGVLLLCLWRMPRYSHGYVEPPSRAYYRRGLNN